ncbi:MAG: 2OG-Fe(II) oxygenase family protein, partial [Pseudomonadota bacterium]
FGREHAKDSEYPDLKEFWHVGREFEEGSPLEKIYPANLWPENPDGFRATFLELFNALEEAGLIMLEALAPSLGVPQDFFRKMATDGNSILRLLHYPPVPEGANPNSIRAAAHEDINLITILVAANGAGLQLLDRDGKWLPVETDPDNLIVDAGDMLARVCNDVIPATTHRVVNPEGGPNVSRYSMPFFMHPHSDALLSCIESCKGDGAKYPDITADAFLKQRLQEIGLAG